MPIGVLVIMLACGLSFAGGMIFIIPMTKGKAPWLSGLGLVMGIVSYLWLSKYFIR